MHLAQRGAGFRLLRRILEFAEVYALLNLAAAIICAELGAGYREAWRLRAV